MQQRRWVGSAAVIRDANTNLRVYGCHVTMHVQGGKKGGQKKGQDGSGGGFVIPQAGAVKRPYTDTAVIMQNLLLVENFARKLGRWLM
jgi:hypothetical protein